MDDDLRIHKFMMGSTRFGMSPSFDDLLSKTVQFGVLGGHFWSEQKSGVRKPLSSARKAKARKAAKFAAKSRRRNRL